MNSARRTVFMETSFPVNITANVLRTAVKLSMMEEFFHSELIDLTSSFGIPHWHGGSQLSSKDSAGLGQSAWLGTTFFYHPF